MDEYCLYLRKSRIDLEAEANGQGDTLARHRAALLKLAQKHGFPPNCLFAMLLFYNL